VMLPDKPDAELEKFIDQWGVATSHNPRQKSEA